MLRIIRFPFLLKLTVFFLLLSPLTGRINAQTNDAKLEKSFGGAVGIDNNGISLLPTFSLNRPAGYLRLSMGRRLTFAPEINFSLDGKPWTILYWLRYKVLDSNKLKLSLGVHPSLLFSTKTTIQNGLEKEIISAERFFVFEIAPNYFLTPTTSIGLYYLGASGFPESNSKHIQFLTFNANFRKIRLSDHYSLRFNPQVYYLNMDKLDGFYVTSTMGITKNGFPISIQFLTNKSIKTNIPNSSKFLWSLGVNYAFGKTYLPK